MRRIDRNAMLAPPCLAGWNNPPDTWDDFGGRGRRCKTEVAEALGAMQGGLCAYCERKLHGDAHIEHFRRKNPKHHPELTFQWSNLFRACGKISAETCGHHKDAKSTCAYQPDELLKPDEDDPDDFLWFHSDGHVRPRDTLDTTALSRATRTIEVLNLNHPGLRAERAKVGRRVRASIEKLLGEISLALEDEDQALEYFAIELSELMMQEPALQPSAHLGATARHLLRPYQPPA